jgi:RNA polymerase sigma-B factor
MAEATRLRDGGAMSATSTIAGRAPALRVARRPSSCAPEHRLLERYRSGDRFAHEELVRRMEPLVSAVVKPYASRSYREDLKQTARLGLLKAIERYDPALGTPLRAYALPTMRGEVKRYLRDHTWAVRPPRALQELVLEVSGAVNELTARLRRSPTVSEIAAHVGIDEETVLDALRAGDAHGAESLDQPVGDGTDPDRTLGETLGGDDDGHDRAEDRTMLAQLRHVLSEQQAAVLSWRFSDDLTQRQIGARLGVSQMQVSRIIRQALARLAAEAGDRQGSMRPRRRA